MQKENIYQFSVNTIDHQKVSLNDFKGKVLLIVNTASECGFTPQLEQLEILRKDFEGRNFEILAFPSNEFGQQEPLEGEEIFQFCTINYNTQFKIFDKITVRGENAHPLYAFLRDKNGNGKVSSIPRWNFHKYLINCKGEVVDYFYSFTKPNSNKIKKAIEKLLLESSNN